MKVSYYELLGMIQEGKNPEQIKLKLNCGERYYQAYYDNAEFSYYGLEEEEIENANFKYYLADTLLESQMIARNIEIIEEEIEIEETKGYENFESIDDYIEHLRRKIDELVREVNKIKKEGK